MKQMSNRNNKSLKNHNQKNKSKIYKMIYKN